ncbi:MAG TPA: hypothetical protein VJ521_16455 [Acidobacteriota bacterium]|nr:hypothetical protein [Acidobacteriota bacterium]
MSYYVPTVPEHVAEGELKEVYDHIKKARKLKRVSPVLEAFSMKPNLLRTVTDLSNQVTFGGSSLGRRFEEMLSTAVSAWNRCHY